jgi:hypothetical protein
MCYTPSYYTANKGGYLTPWPQNVQVPLDEIEPLDGKTTIKVAGLVAHSFIFGNKNCPSYRWDAVNGWAKKPAIAIEVGE